ncbi:hypothetical protein BGX29_005166 [Mortierella sp. GBA35]|nr:hypothetical protein BGX29_005166 [Mortierella sp. GBA35]
MTSVSASPAPHVSLERRVTSPTTRATNIVSPTSPSQKPTLATNRRFSGVQSKIGSLEAINYKPKPSEKKIQSFTKSDFSHVRAKVDAKMLLPTQPAAQANTDAPAPPSPGVAKPTAKRPTVLTTGLSTAPSSGTGRSTVTSPSSSQPQRALSPPSSRSSTASRSIRTAASSAISAATQASTVAAPRSPPHSRRSSTSSVTNLPMSPTSPTRRLSKHIIPTQKATYDHVKSKVGSLENINYAARERPSSRDSSADEGNGRSRSPSARSSTSSTSAAPTSPTSSTGRRSSFKIPPSKKVDYSKVQSKVGSLENVTHTPQGGNIRIFNEKLSAREAEYAKVQSKVGSLEYVHHIPQGGNLKVFSEKLNFREQAQSKIAKEINIVQFYQSSEMSFETSIQEDKESEGEGNKDIESSVIYSEADQDDDFEPPKNILSVLEEITEAVDELDLQESAH